MIHPELQIISLTLVIPLMVGHNHQEKPLSKTPLLLQVCSPHLGFPAEGFLSMQSHHVPPIPPMVREEQGPYLTSWPMSSVGTGRRAGRSNGNKQQVRNKQRCPAHPRLKLSCHQLGFYFLPRHPIWKRQDQCILSSFSAWQPVVNDNPAL